MIEIRIIRLLKLEFIENINKFTYRFLIKITFWPGRIYDQVSYNRSN